MGKKTKKDKDNLQLVIDTLAKDNCSGLIKVAKNAGHIMVKDTITGIAVKVTMDNLLKAQNIFDKSSKDKPAIVLNKDKPKDKDKPAIVLDKDKPKGLGMALIANAIKGLDKDKDKDKGLDTQKSIIPWFKASYDVVVVNRANGIVYNALVGASHKKVVKVPTFENKGGLFFGGLLNSVMQPLAKSGLTTYHSKSNVYKTTKKTLTKTQAISLRQAIVKVIGPSKVAVDNFAG